MRIINYRKFLSKKGTACLICAYETTPTEFELSHGQVGNTVKEDFIPADFHSLFQPDVIGKELILDYGVAVLNGRPVAQISSVKFK